MSYKSLREAKIAFWKEELKGLQKARKREATILQRELQRVPDYNTWHSNSLYLSGFEIVFEGNDVYFTDCRL